MSPDCKTTTNWYCCILFSPTPKTFQRTEVSRQKTAPELSIRGQAKGKDVAAFRVVGDGVPSTGRDLRHRASHQFEDLGVNSTIRRMIVRRDIIFLIE